MKKSSILVVALLVVLLCAGTIYAKFKTGYEVVSATKENVVIKSAEEEKITVPNKSGKFRVGDKVLYDKKKNMIRPDIGGC